MKISYTDLKKYFVDDITIEELSKSLFHLGHENDVTDSIIDIEFTPNKGDCLSLNGILRDLSTLHNIDFKIEKYDKDIDELDYSFINQTKDFCNKISFLYIETESINGNYKEYLDDYFKKIKHKKNNIFTDISNFVMYELGQPTHCYDFKSVKGGLILTKLNEDAHFESLQGQEINLNADEIVFKNTDGQIVNLPGVIGGNNSKCKMDTNSVLIECAHFNPDKIIGKNIKYGTNSDAAYRFERGVDINLQEDVLRRIIYIISDHVNVKKINIATYDFEIKKNKKINFNIYDINKVLGINIDEKKALSIFDNLGFYINDINEIIVPSWRNDISTINDIAEEIARVIGYNSIQATYPKITKNHDISFLSSPESKLRKYLVGEGFYEVINDPFVDKGSNDSISIDNPLDTSRSFLRSNIYESLIDNLEYNEKRQKDSIKFFEISDIYTNNKIEKKLSIIISGRLSNDLYGFGKKLDANFFINLLGVQNQDQFSKLIGANLNQNLKIKFMQSKLI